MNQTLVDCHGNPLDVGDSVKVIDIPAWLPQGLPEEDQIAICSQIGKTLIIQGFNGDGDAELEFVNNNGHIHTIWIKPHCLEKIQPVPDIGGSRK